MNENKDEIKSKIASLEACVKMEAKIRETVAKFKHRKQVNQTFIDALKEDGTLHAYISKDKYSTKLTISPVPYDSQGYEFTLYRGEFTERRPITWSCIEKELERYSFSETLKGMENRLQVFESELLKLEKIFKDLDQVHLTCFDIWEAKHIIEDIILHAQIKKASQENL